MYARIRSGARRWAPGTVVVLTTAGLFVAVPGAVHSAWAEPSDGLVVNEVYGGGGNNGSHYNRDFIELANRGPDAVSVAGWSVQYHSGSGTGAWQKTDLTGSIPAGGLFLIGEASGTGGDQAALPAVDASGGIAMSATAGTVALVHSTTLLTCTADTCGAEASIVDLVGFGTAAIRETSPALGASNSTSVQRFSTPDTDDNSEDFFSELPSPRATNPEPEPEQCPEPGPVRVHDIQGDGWLSPLRNQTVTDVPGVVTGVRATGSSRGYWIQDPVPDANPATSEAVFVFVGSSAPLTVAPGDAVLVTGRVQSFYPTPSGETFPNVSSLSITEISGNPTVRICSPGNPLPAAEVIGASSIPDSYPAPTPTGNVEDLVPVDPTRSVQEFWRSRLGMLVQVNDVRVVGPGNEFGEVYVTVKPGEAASVRGGTLIAGYDAVPTGRIVVFPVTGTVAAADVGDVLRGATAGPVDYSLFGGFGIAATTVGGRDAKGLPRQVAAQPAADQLSVATYNVENLSPANPQSKFDALAAGIVTNLRSPDIVTLEEIQDNDGETDSGTVDATHTLDRFVAAIVAAGGPAYQYRQINPANDEDGGAPGGNIRVAFLVNPARVTFVDRPGGDSTTAVAVGLDFDGTARLSVSPGRIEPTNVAWSDSRKPLAGEFRFNGAKVIVVANHFNSKGGDQNADGRFQPPARASEVQRMRQAAQLRAFTDQVLAVDPFANIVVAGDLNDFQFSPVVQTLTTGTTGLTALVSTLPANQQYTYVFNGISQVLDHILVSPALRDVSYEIVHLNAEFADQASDHDPQVVRVRPAAACSRTITGTYLGALNVDSGTLCVLGATVVGAVRVGPGVKVVIVDATIVGSVRTTGAVAVNLCGASILGSLEVRGSTGPVRLGGPGCAASSVIGAVTIDANSGGVLLAGNRVVGALSCDGNEPAPTNGGVPNDVTGAGKGQCAGL